MAQAQNKIGKILAIEGAMHIAQKRPQIPLRGVHREVEGGIIHHLDHTACALDNRLAVTPCDSRGQEASNLPIFQTVEGVRYADRVGLDKVGAIVAIVQRFEQLAQLIVREFRVFDHRSSQFCGRPARQVARRA